MFIYSYILYITIYIHILLYIIYIRFLKNYHTVEQKNL
jgi:hypothetical protein